MDGGRGLTESTASEAGAAVRVGVPMDNLLGPQQAERPSRHPVAAAKPPESTATAGSLPHTKAVTSVDRRPCELTHPRAWHPGSRGGLRYCQTPKHLWESGAKCCCGVKGRTRCSVYGMHWRVWGRACGKMWGLAGGAVYQSARRSAERRGELSEPSETCPPLRGFPGGTSGKESARQCRRYKKYSLHPWAGKIPRRRKWQPTPVFSPGKPRGQRSLVGNSPQGPAAAPGRAARTPHSVRRWRLARCRCGGCVLADPALP